MPQGLAGPLTERFLGEIQDPPHRLIAKDGNTTPIFEAAMERSQSSPEQTMKDIGTAFIANLTRQSATEEGFLTMMSQLLKAGNIAREGTKE